MSPSSSAIISLLLCYFCLFYLLQSSESSSITDYYSSEDDQPYRTAYHFQPPRNWMNDPNGPMIYEGLYHLFYQYNPKGAVWASDIVWAHSTSKDLINWIPREPVLYPSQHYDINGCWSGSATILPGGKPAVLYTGINAENQQVQNIAFPKNLSDPYLEEWVKSPLNPVIDPNGSNMTDASSFDSPTIDYYTNDHQDKNIAFPMNNLPEPNLIEMVQSTSDPDMIDASNFRDPSTGWLGPDGRWRVIIGSKRGKRGIAILYWSKDFIHWVKAKQPLHSAEDTGMWECPDFFPVSTIAPVGLNTSVDGPNVKHVLKVSLFDNSKEYYTTGTYDYAKDVYVPNKGSIDDIFGLRFDYGKFYASKTFFDSAKNRRVLWGWINESSSADDDIKKGWSGIQAAPRAIWLDKSGKHLVQWPITELETLRTGHVDMPSKLLDGGSTVEVLGLTASQADVEMSFKVTNLEKAEKFDPSWTNAEDLCARKVATVKGEIGPFGIMALASKGLEEYTAIFFRIFKANNNKYVVLMCSDQSRSSLDDSTDKANYGVFLDVDPTKEKLSLRTLIDHSIVESFGGEGKGCITARVYPTMAIGDGAHLHVFNNAAEAVRISSFSGWSMNKAQIN
ncbi:beta-fructofuranosidase, insoluble isoenzyme CWINV1-like [Punica granatum]|uniref:Beta-fructofuranosidase, insoluble isoenzyme CWINV1-like n=1 Tax=Punica granatum TaxID=22663 RepID=A0A6P8E4J1_PUNGR|nr:beta-fructofuranosidase, insoluble isoenzyme CWINV1-like [Punica granatum]